MVHGRLAQFCVTPVPSSGSSLFPRAGSFVARMVEPDRGLNHFGRGRQKIKLMIQTRAPRQTKNMLDALVEGKALSPDGYNFVIQNLDSFHDRSFPPTGDPDICTARSVTRCIQLSQDVTSSQGDGLWDLDIFFLPLTAGVYMTPGGPSNPQSEFRCFTSGSGGAIADSSYAVYTTPLAATMNVIQAPAGVDWKLDTSSVCLQQSTIGLPNTVAADQFRLVGCAYEVVNNTPELYRGGSVATYRSPSNPSPAFWWFTNWTGTQNVTTTETTKVKLSSVQMELSPTFRPPLGKVQEMAPPIETLFSPFQIQRTPVVTGPVVSLPPSNLADINFLPGSLTWGAEDGVYQTITRNEINNPPINTLASFGAAVNNYGTQSIINSRNCWLPDPAVCTANGTRYYSNYALPYDCCGSKFTGLDPHSTLTITVRYFVESFPTPTNEVLASLSRPSPKYDPIAFNIYSMAMDSLPVACTQGENPFGEWFKGVLSEVAKWAAPVGNALATIFPPAAAIGKVVGTAAGAVNTLIPAEKKKKKKEKQKSRAQTQAPPVNNRAPQTQGTSKSAKKRQRAKANKLPLEGFYGS